MINFLRRLVSAFVSLRSNVQAAVAKKLVERRVINVLKLTHAQELSTIPRNEWPMVRAKQIQEIQAVRDGQFDVVDRRSWAFPYLPEALHRLNQPILKNTPYNLRRFSETPIPRRAINLVKNSILSLKWKIQPTTEEDDIDPERELRINIATESLKRPNNIDSFRELMEAAIEDLLLGGYMTLEPRMTPYYKRPFKVWAVDGSTIRLFMDWTESTPDRPRFAQMTGLKGERGIVTFLDSELIYVRDNVRTSTPFGLGKMEVAFNSINSFLGVQDMAGRAGADQVHKTWLWWENTMNPAHVQTVRRHIINEIEGQAKVSLVSGIKKPQVVDVIPVTPEDLLLDWQRFLIDVIAAAFDLSPMALGQTEKVNKAVGQVLADSDFRSAVVPTAKRIEEGITRHLLHGFMGWKDIEFKFIGLDDPDALTATMIQKADYMSNAITPDEIREVKNRPPLPAGWGKLTFSQMQIMMMAEMAKMTGKMSGMGSMGMGSGMGSSGMGSGGMGQGGSGSTSSLSAQAEQIAQSMSPQDIQLFQEFGILPPSVAMQPQMQDPSILEQITDQLQSYFEHLEQVEEMDEVPEAPITEEDEQQQLQRFYESEHQESLAEKSINRRGVFGPAINQQIRKSAERGKYPRSGGRAATPEGIVPETQMDKAQQKIKNNYRPGRGNPYSR